MPAGIAAWVNMAKIVSVLCMSHSPYAFTQPAEWEPARDRRKADGGIALDVPVETMPEMEAKKARLDAAFAALHARFVAAKPDVVIVFGDDQLEQFRFSGFPAFAVYCGAEFEGYRTLQKPGLPTKAPREFFPKTAETWVTVRTHEPLARAIMTGLVERDFDPAFSLELANREEGMGHAFMRPLHILTPQQELPVVAISINCYYGPQPTGRRCAQLGAAVREIVAAMPDDLRVAVVGSGGLWHTPMRPDAMLDEAFDRAMLDALARGDAAAMARTFDDLGRGPVSERDLMIESGGTGMRLGVGLGTGETRNWIAAAGTAGGAAGEIVDYVPVYASPIGMAFAAFRVSAI